ncbi:bifunctional FO biosynthesis protein CofGH [Microbacterium kribbense]|uniref:7,8-didemethyl-8-hydroxy-5-deazariboflavin synthase n=1 Tax=Microbacterium kribbense TaxID=433645 RepID=A0ABP7G622_9MICO
MTTVEPASVRDLPPVSSALDAAAAGQSLDVAAAEALLTATGADFDRLLQVAASLRDRGLAAAGRPGVITYSRKAFVPLTTLCRDRCHYCAFVDTPGQLAVLHKPAYMSPERVRTVVHRAQAMGCKEALITLGERPEDRWPQARAWLDEHGYASTLHYVAATARMITAETGMLAHLNPGAMSLAEMTALRPTAPSMGMMLETTSERLFREPGQAHYGSPDKDPAVRLQAIEDAGRARIPFTTGILVGIGETLRDRAESLIAIRDAHARHGHVQEVIVQNFRAKPGTAMRDAPDADPHEYLAAVATARLVLGPGMHIQVPPNLSDPDQLALLVAAGIDDWGGVSPLTADHVNPERPWPRVERLAERTAALGFTLEERLTAHPEYVQGAATWIDPGLHGAVATLADGRTGLARAGDRRRAAAGVAEAGSHALSSSGRGANGRSGLPLPPGNDRPGSQVAGSGIAGLAEAAAADPEALDDAEWVALLEADGTDLDALTETANDVRRFTVGEAVSLVVNRNLTTTGFGELFGLDDVGAIAADAWELGATELCIQGRLPAAADPAAYLEIVRAAKAAVPRLHVHAYRPQDVWDFAGRIDLDLDRALEALLEAGVGSVPGTGVKVLSERVRRLVAPDDLPTGRWIEAITAAHEAGFTSTSVLFYGHVETAAERVAHLRELRRIQDETGGFTEFVPIPLPGPAGGVPLVPGRATIDEHRAMVAVSRLLLSGSIPHIQIPWPRLGQATTRTLLLCGGDDLGGALLDGRVLPEAGVECGRQLPVPEAAALAAHLFRPFHQRTTQYREPDPDRKAALR